MLCLAESYEELYCFSFKPNVDEEERLLEWAFLDVRADYGRMGLPNSQWKLSPVNKHYKVSEPASPEHFHPNMGCGGCSESCCAVLKGERHLPRRPVCARVCQTSGHRRQLQVQKQRQISCSVILLQRKSCELPAYLFVFFFFFLHFLVHTSPHIYTGPAASVVSQTLSAEGTK